MLGGRFLRDLPPGFAENPVVELRGMLGLFREPDWSELRRNITKFEGDGLCIDLLSPSEASARLGGALTEDALDGAAFLPENGFLDVHELLSSYTRHAKRRGVQFRFRTEVLRLLTENGTCCGVETRDGPARARALLC